MSTTIINVSKRRKIISLDHPAFYSGRYGFRRRVIRTSDLNPKTGVRGVLEQRKGTPGTLTLLAGQRLEGLPDAIVGVPDVKRLRAAGDIRLEVAPDPKPRSQAPRAAPSKATPSETMPSEAPASTEKNGKAAAVAKAKRGE